MKIQDAIHLMKSEQLIETNGKRTDLGSGVGIFTYALANLLVPQYMRSTRAV
ncbi:hypothetical protein [Dyadobacter psychrotolerans]|uniref:hypothetical protein n=1 Tax=Dyadobacter psychrotolerans TaxID=2541721 RepID=UPI001404BBBA|nr:hypothetical protein [Dyadobacter psychrotolerans]